MNNKRQQAED